MKNFLQQAAALGFSGCATVDVNQIPFDASLLKYCQENLCGRYGANYSCPPYCGTPQQMKDKVLSCKGAVVVQSVFDNVNFDDAEAVSCCKALHNSRLCQLLQYANQQGRNAFVIGATGCEKCNPCLVAVGQPCPYGEQVFSCTSAYCIDVAKLLQVCNLAYEWCQGKLFLCGLLVLR